MYSTGIDDKLEFNQLIAYLVQKNLFTKRQITIIYNKLKNEKSDFKISSGAYYRQIKQSKKKYHQLICTIILFRLLNILDNNKLSTIETIINQINNISQVNQHHNINITLSNDIIDVIDQIVNKISTI